MFQVVHSNKVIYCNIFKSTIPYYKTIDLHKIQPTHSSLQNEESENDDEGPQRSSLEVRDNPLNEHRMQTTETAFH